MAVATAKGSESRQRILDAATTAFSERGYVGTSLNDLIRLSGLTKGGFYFHFASKAELAVAVHEQGEAEIQRQVLAAMGDSPRAIERLRGLVYGAFHKCDGPAMPALRRLCDELNTDEVDGLRLEPPYELWASITTRLVAEALAQGDVREGVDPASFALMATSTFFGLLQSLHYDHVAMLTHYDAYVAFVFSALEPGAVE